MKRKAFVLIAVFIIFSILCGCKKLSLPSFKRAAPKQASEQASMVKKGKVIAKINNFVLTLEELNEEVDAFNAMVPEDKPEAKINSREKKIDYLKNEMVRRTLLYQEAMDKGLDRKDEVQSALEKSKQDLLVMELVKEEADKAEVSSAEIEDYYNRFKEQLKEPEERQIREMITTTEAEAREVLIQLLQGADFASLAREKSKAASAKEGGDLGFISPGKKSPQFDAVAFSESLETGKFSNIFKGSEGYYILKLEAKRGGKLKSLSEMWDDIKRGLTFLKQQQRIEELIGKLSQAAKIEIYEGEIK